MFILSLRVIQAVLTILILGLSGYGKKRSYQRKLEGKQLTNNLPVANWWGSYWNAGAPSSVAFLVFCSVITLLALAYLILVPMRWGESKLNHAGVIAGIEGFILICWFAGFVALAVFLSGRVCFGHVCSAAKAAAAFGAFQW